MSREQRQKNAQRKAQKEAWEEMFGTEEEQNQKRNEDLLRDLQWKSILDSTRYY